MQDIIVTNGGVAVVFSFTDGCKCPRKETLVEQARKGAEELQQVCLWLELHGHRDLAEELLDRFV